MYKQGDVLLIPIPFTDLSTSKKRPVLVISNSEYNRKTEDLIVAAITSNIDEKDYSIVFNNGDMIEGNIKVVSCVRADKIYTLSKTIVTKKIGTVAPQVVGEVKKRIMYWLDEK